MLFTGDKFSKSVKFVNFDAQYWSWGHKAPLIRITNSLLQKCAFILSKALKAKIAPMTILLEISLT
jgi:CRISPR/Cas system CMR-associated protein Cmr5 small subunit